MKKDRLRPGKMLLVDTVAGKIIDDDALKERYADKQDVYKRQSLSSPPSPVFDFPCRWFMAIASVSCRCV